jgi:hypothetical protein
MSTKRRRSFPPLQRISGPGELLQAVPYLLGFHPRRSLVLVGLDVGILVVTARMDLCDAQAGGIAHTLDALVRGGSTSILAAIYDDDARPDPSGRLPWRSLVAALDRDTEDAGCALLDVLLVAAGRWWSYSCDSPLCCPADGTPVPDEPSAFAAAATVEGVVALPDRAALEAQLDPLPDAERSRLHAVIERAENAAVQETVDGHERRYERAQKRALLAVAQASDEPGWPGLADDDSLARFGVALGAAGVRDELWMAVDAGRVDGRPLWRELGRRLPRPYDAPALFLFGWAAWRSGDGALASIAAERAVASDPGYSAADLLRAALSYGVDPRRMPRLRLPRPA